MKPPDVVKMADGVKPLVRYFCIINGCGLVTLWIDELDGRPIWGYQMRNVAKRPWPGGPGNAWEAQGYLDEPGFSAREFGCRQHGPFYITRAQMLGHYEEATRGKPTKVKIDEGSPFFGPLS